MKVCLKILSPLMALCLIPDMMFGADQTIADHINAGGTVTVIQPQALNARLQKIVTDVEMTAESDEQTISAAPKVKAGYRVQIFDDNNVRTAKQEAQSRKQQIETHFPHLSAYVTFNSPYWRVKVGDFTTRSEAEAAMAEIRQAFPAMAKSLRIVRDRIKQ